jgi:hypothetical protein
LGLAFLRIARRLLKVPLEMFSIKTIVFNISISTYLDHPSKSTLSQALQGVRRWRIPVLKTHPTLLMQNIQEKKLQKEC